MAAAEPLARSLASAYPHGGRVRPHHHAWGQLVHAMQGALWVRSGDSLWLVPPARALWMPAGVEHALTATGATRLAALYLTPRLAGSMPTLPEVLELSALARALLAEIVDSVPIGRGDPRRRRLLWALLDALREAPPAPYSLRLPLDARARSLAESWLAGQGDGERLADAGKRFGASVRTLQRAFAPTGLRIAEWRSRARLLRSLGVADEAQKRGVAIMADAAGYASVSAYTVAFRRAFGRTPGASLRVDRLT